MKVILIKDCKEGKVNDVIEVSRGYATNFLIKKSLAVPYNSKTEHMLKNKLLNIEKDNQDKIKNANKVKEAIEKIVLTFKLKVTNMVVHGHVTKKQVLKELERHGIKLNSHSIKNVQIASLGTTLIPIKLYNNVIANLKIEVLNAE
ncbi:MAG: 50S ribosomal protein L9 [Mycoplasmatales bacterium]|nr:50S ribosomal protein L9 [Mycoplasmatales bacterium]